MKPFVIPPKCYLRRIVLGQASNEKYQLAFYVYHNFSKRINGQVRAKDREEAKRKILKEHPNAEFWN